MGNYKPEELMTLPYFATVKGITLYSSKRNCVYIFSYYLLTYAFTVCIINHTE